MKVFVVLFVLFTSALCQTTESPVMETPAPCAYEVVPGEPSKFRLIANPAIVWSCAPPLVWSDEDCTCDYNDDPAAPIPASTCDSSALISLKFDGTTEDKSCTGAWINAMNKPYTFVTGKVGQAAVFTAGSQLRIDYYVSRFQGNVESFSVAFWIRSRQTFLKKTVIDYGGCTASSEKIFQVVIENDSSVSVNMKSTTGVVGTVAGGSVTIDAFTHIAVSYNLNTLSLYIDGVLIDSTALTGPVKNSPTCPMIVNGIDTLDMDADLDQLRFFNVAIDQAKVSSLVSEV
jgi:hypothetical protein